MFSGEKLRVDFPSLFVEPPPAMEGRFFSHANCPALPTEDCVEVRIGRKSDFRNALHFWVAASRQDMETAYRFKLEPSPQAFSNLMADASDEFREVMDNARYALCDPMTERHYLQFLAECVPASVCQAMNLPHLGGSYVDGMHMLREWNDIIVMAELTDHFVWIQWFTGA